MGLFSRNKSIVDSDIFTGFTDWHCHLLPGVDDGVKTIDETLRILDDYGRLGVANVWLTPHIMEDVPNETAALRQRFAELKAAYHGPVNLHLAAENMLDNLFEERLKSGDLLPIGDDGDHLLVETSYFTPPSNMDELLYDIKSKGFFPVLAHPERYVYMDDRDYKRLHDEGILFQLNIYSMTGAYGDTARKKAKALLKKGWYFITGSDTHRHAQLSFSESRCLATSEAAAITSLSKSI